MFSNLNPFKIMTKLADIIRALTAQEKAEGQEILKALEALKSALASSDTKFSALSEQIATLSEEVAGVPGLKAQIEALQAELSDATEAAQLISEINAAPEVVQTPTVPQTPEVVQTPVTVPAVETGNEVVE